MPSRFDYFVAHAPKIPPEFLRDSMRPSSPRYPDIPSEVVEEGGAAYYAASEEVEKEYRALVEEYRRELEKWCLAEEARWRVAFARAMIEAANEAELNGESR